MLSNDIIAELLNALNLQQVTNIQIFNEIKIRERSAEWRTHYRNYMISRELGHMAFRGPRRNYKQCFTVSKKYEYWTNFIGSGRNKEMSFLYVTQIPREIKYLTNLTDIIFRVNFIRAIPREIKYLINLRKLDMGINEIKIIPTEIKYIRNIEILNLGGNHITTIPAEIKYLKKLRVLDLDGTAINAIPKEIRYLRNLERLLFKCYNFNSIPIELKYLQKLIEFKMHSLTPIADFDNFKYCNNIIHLHICINNVEKFIQIMKYLPNLQYVILCITDSKIWTENADKKFQEMLNLYINNHVTYAILTSK